MQFVNVVYNPAQVVSAGNLVLDLTENLPDFIFEGIRSGRFLLEAVQVGKQLEIHKADQVVASLRPVRVNLSIAVPGSCPAFPSKRLVEDEGVGFFIQPGHHGLVLLQFVKIFQEKQP